MRIFVVLFSVLTLVFSVPAQAPDTSPTPPAAASDAEALPDQDKSDFQAAVSEKDAGGRVRALARFLETYPDSELRPQAAEVLTAARAELAAKAVEGGDAAEGMRLFRLAVSEAPQPVSDRLFTGVLMQIPNTLFFKDLRNESYEIASLIESKVDKDAKKLLGLSTFYITVENSSEATRLALQAIDLSPDLPAAYQTLGLASRLGFDLGSAEEAYLKALEIDPSSNISRRSLAEIKRGLGKSEEAISLYDAIIAADPSDANAGTGRTLALFDAGRTSEAESSLETLLAVNPRNIVLLSGAAYWYAANGSPEKAVAYATQALAVEPRYTWSYIALGRGLLGAGKPLDAERVLISATQYGYFPTLDYEIAAARLEAGLYREAAEALNNSFSISDGTIKTRLGGRIERSADNFIELLALERRAGIFQPSAAQDPRTADRLKRLLRFNVTLEAGNSAEEVEAAADAFVAGSDPTRTYRQLYAAGRLLEKKVALSKVSELARGAVDGVDESMNVATPEAAVLADELYESRRIAITRGTAIVVPEIPKQTLTRIVRGRIEELDGWAQFEQGEAEEAAVHLKRSLSILPKDSAWSRSVHWRLGTVLQSQGKDSEALDNYIASYRSGEPNEARKIVIEDLYRRLNGSLEGLETRLQSAEPRTEAASLLVKTPDQPQMTSPAESSVRDRTVSDPSTSGGNPEETSNKEEAASVTDPAVNGAPQAHDPDQGVTEISKIELKDLEAANGEAMERLKIPVPPAIEAVKDEPAATKVDGEKEPEKDEPEAVAGVPAEDTQPPETNSDSPSRVTDDGETVEPPAATKEDGSGRTTRPRLVPESRSRIAGESPAVPVPCSLVLSQDSATIAAGGSTGILVGVEGASGVFRLRALTSSPSDITVEVDRSVEALVGRAMFLIKSVSSRSGSYSVTFETSCGNKEIPVSVR